MGIRPTEDPGVFWLTFAGFSIDSALLSTNYEELTRAIREKTGLQSFEVTEFMTMTNFGRYLNIHYEYSCDTNLLQSQR